MGKKPGIRLTVNGGMRVVRPTTAEDAIWDAVETARNYDMPFDDFIAEVKDAWVESLRDEAKEIERKNVEES